MDQHTLSGRTIEYVILDFGGERGLESSHVMDGDHVASLLRSFHREDDLARRLSAGPAHLADLGLRLAILPQDAA